MAPHSSTLAWKIPWMEEPGRMQSMGLQRVGHDWATSLSLFTFMHWRRKWQATPVFLPVESQGWGNLEAAVYGVTQSWTQLKWLSSSTIICSTMFKCMNCMKIRVVLSKMQSVKEILEIEEYITVMSLFQFKIMLSSPPWNVFYKKYWLHSLCLSV